MTALTRATGVGGATGPGGPASYTGYTGRSGVQGKAGAQGYQGAQGSRGPQGPQGTSSASGGYNPATVTHSYLSVNIGAASPTGTIQATGSITAGYSDKRLKHEIEIIKDAVDKLKSITGIYFRTNETGKKLGLDTGRRQIGLIAQQIEAIAPELVTKAALAEELDNGNNYLTVKYDRVVALLLQAIKEQQAQINILKQKVEQREVNG